MEVELCNLDTHESAPRWSAEGCKKTFLLIIFSISWTIVLTFVPVLVPQGNDNLYRKEGFYNPDDIIRFIEPLGGLPLNFGIFLLSDVHLRRDSVPLLILFSFGGAVYVQGAAFHSASNMFKHAVEMYEEINGEQRYITDIIYWMQTVWEHYISHYVYAGGFVVMAFCIVLAYKNHELPTKISNQDRRICEALITAAVILYGILLSGVMIDFPLGTIFGFVYLVLYGVGWLGYLVYESGGKNIYSKAVDGKMWALAAHRPVLFFYLCSHFIGLAIVILWVIAVGGFKSRTQAGM